MMDRAARLATTRPDWGTQVELDRRSAGWQRDTDHNAVCDSDGRGCRSRHLAGRAWSGGSTLCVYWHLVPGSNRNAVTRLDDMDDVPLKVVSAEAV